MRSSRHLVREAPQAALVARSRPMPAMAFSPLPTVDEKAKWARDLRLASEKLPPRHADVSSWPDPDDTLRTRSPKQVKGHRRGDVLGRLHRRGEDVTRDHLEAALSFRCDWDVAQLGYSPGDLLQEWVGGSAGPSAGPSLAARTRAAKEREVRRVLAAVGPSATPLLLWVAVGNRDLASWCADQAAQHGRKPDPKKVLGRLLATLDRLVDFYGVHHRQADLQQASHAG